MYDTESKGEENSTNQNWGGMNFLKKKQKKIKKKEDKTRKKRKGEEKGRKLGSNFREPDSSHFRC